MIARLLTATYALLAALGSVAVGDEIRFIDVQELTLEGRGWSDTEAPFDRLPGRARGSVRDAVWELSRHSAGLCARFVTDATEIRARWSLSSPRMAMPHMSATAVTGLDLYVRQDDRWRWLASTRPTSQEMESLLIGGMPEGRREYLLYLPLYNGVTALEVGVGTDRELAPADDRPASRRRPIVFYGTLITQGACASRPGMSHVAMLGRRLDRPVINLGFAGQGTMDPELAALLAELDPALYVIDCLPNMHAPEIGERLEPLIGTLRNAHPDTPILLVEDRTYTNAFLRPQVERRNQTSRAALRAGYERLRQQGDDNLHYLEGALLLGEDGEAAVDGSHPSDLGFARQAELFAAAIAPLLPSGQDPTQDGD